MRMTSLQREQLLGSWRLASWVIEYPQGKRVAPFGEDAIGQLIYAADGGMSATMQRCHRTALDASVPARASLATRAAIAEEYLAYSGTWVLENNTIVHRVQHSANPVLIGTEQRREADLDGDRLTLTATEEVPTRRLHRIEWLRGVM
jgi:hypothetical protein